ncbi:MAG: hypothetical protein AB7C98_05180 [Acidithiobacillus sp.]
MDNSNQLSDMLFASVRKLEADELLFIERVLSDMECVISAHQGSEHKEHHGHHFKVAYDPSCVTSQAILTKLKEFGVDARLIGL